MEDYGTFGLVSSFKRKAKPPKYRYTFFFLIVAIVVLIAAALYYFLS